MSHCFFILVRDLQNSVSKNKNVTLYQCKPVIIMKVKQSELTVYCQLFGRSCGRHLGDVSILWNRGHHQTFLSRSLSVHFNNNRVIACSVHMFIFLIGHILIIMIVYYSWLILNAALVCVGPVGNIQYLNSWSGLHLSGISEWKSVVTAQTYQCYTFFVGLEAFYQLQLLLYRSVPVC